MAMESNGITIKLNNMKKVVIKNVSDGEDILEALMEALMSGKEKEILDACDEEEENDEEEEDDEESYCPLEEVINCITKDID